MAQKTLDFTRFQLAEKYTPGGATPDTTITVIATSEIYNLDLQRQGGTLTKFRLTLREYTDTTKEFRVGIEDVASSSLVDGKMKYVLNIRLSSAGNLMIGLANDDDGTDNDDNIIATNLTALNLTTFSKQSSANLVVGTGEFAEFQTNAEEVLAEVKEESNLIAAGQNSKIRANNARLIRQQDDYETAITLQQTNYETAITTQQNEFEVEQQQNFDNFVADQFKITGQPKTGDATKLEISGGDWLDGNTERSFTATEETPALSTTTFYELVAGSGALSSNEIKFTSGNFPICKVVTDGSGITTVTNYGAAYLIGGAGGGSFDGDISSAVYTDDLLTSFDDADAVTWTITYDSNNMPETITDGIDTTTINRDSDGNFTGITIS